MANSLEWSTFSRRQITHAVQLLNALFFAAYFLHLRADFPHDSPWNDFAKFTDEGWYAGAALHRLQTGHWLIAGGFNPAVGLPMWPLLLAGWFALVGGPGILAARVLTLLLFGGSLVLVEMLLRPLTGRLAAAATVTLVLVNPFCFAFDRLALLEPLVVFLFLLALWLATVPSRTASVLPLLPRAIAVGALLTAAILTKTTSIVLAPALLYHLWAAAAGPIQPAYTHAHPHRMHRLGLQVKRHREALLLPLVAAVTSATLWAVYFFAFVRPHHLADFHHLFAVNAGRAHARILLQVMVEALGDTLWIDRILLPLTMLAVAASTLFLRELWRVPLFVSNVLALATTVGFIGWHTWFQPRYYVLCVMPAMIVLALAGRALRDRTRPPKRGSPWKIAYRVSLVAVGVAAVTMLLQTGRDLLRPQYTMRDAAASIATILRADPAHAPILLAGPGDTIALFTGIHSVNPEWPIGSLPALLQREQPGWFAAFSPREDGRLDEMRTLYTLAPVAEFRIFDEPEHRVLRLYRLDPLSPK